MGLTPVEFRLRFPALRRWTWLNAASAGPLPFAVARAAFDSYEGTLQNGDADWMTQAAGVDQARRDVAALLNCQPRGLAFTRNTSHGANLVAQMLKDAGARSVLAFAEEFPASTIPFLNLGYDVRLLPRGPDEGFADRVAEAIEGRDVLVASHVMFSTGTVQDPALLSRIAESAGAVFVACVTQSLGALQFDFAASGARFAIGTSHKWLCGGYGGGYLAIHPEFLGKFRWPQVGWMSVEKPGRMRPDATDFVQDARALEMGCPPYPAIHALGAAARLWLEAGPADVERRVRALNARLRSLLREAGFEAPALPPAATSGIVTVPVANALAVAERMRDQDVAVSARGNGIRFATHAFNDESDLARGVAALVDAVRAP